ncbi:hypothetical protein [Metabacillus sp. 84]|uniref:hypothetical protein n=1 Tax=Metabacillus sp. 84 TaxID=3404705 RepID=UPI003CF4EC8F
MEKKQPMIDAELFEISQLLFNDPTAPMPSQALLQSSLYDYTIESLILIEHYLDSINGSRELAADYSRVILRIGAYTGEVIRRNAEREYHWYDYKEAIQLQPILGIWGEQIDTKAVLYCSAADHTVLPLQKVGKYLENGIEDSLIVFGSYFKSC